MAATIISTIPDARSAQRLVDELIRSGGLEDRDVEVLAGEEDQLVAEIVERGFDEDDARGYAQAARQGRVLVAARAPEPKVDQTVSIMERYEGGGSAPAGERGSAAADGETTLQEVEEQLAIHKGQTVTGGVRVTTQVRERPVEQTVTLREEQVEVERRAADRKLTPEQAEAAFQDKAAEMLETGEEVEVGKQARVVGEVTVGKRVEERQETVKDTVRRTEVEVEEIKPGSPRNRQRQTGTGGSGGQPHRSSVRADLMRACPMAGYQGPPTDVPRTVEPPVLIPALAQFAITGPCPIGGLSASF